MSKQPQRQDEPAAEESRDGSPLQKRTDTGHLRVLDGVSGVKELQRGAEPDSDPYNQTIPPGSLATPKPKRRSLDDMRQLSESIKAARDKEKEAAPGKKD